MSLNRINLKFLLIPFIATTVMQGGCKKLKESLEQPKLPPPQTGMAEQVSPTLNISLDASVTDKERSLFREDIKFLQSVSFKPDPNGYFFNAFSNNGEIDLLKFVDDRVGFIVGMNTSIESRFSYTADTSRTSLPPPGDPQRQASGKAVTIATNIGTAVWLETIAQKRSIDFFINNTSVPVNDPRVGIVRLAEGYTNYDGEGHPMNTVARTTVLIHEARHSDCTGGLSDRDALNLAAGQLPENRSCGHLHTICEGGDYDGLPACDGREWGSYAMGWLYANEFRNSCANCTEAMLQTARIVAIDALSRVGEGRAAAMAAKRLPPPDLSSNPARP